MLVFSAICPHPPILIPGIGKDNLSEIDDTVLAMEKLEQELYASKPDIIVIISPHGEIIHESFLINLNPVYKVNFEAFGDWQTKLEFFSSPELVARIKEMAKYDLPIILSSQEQLDHGVAVPLYYLTRHLKNIPIVPISYCFLDFDKHWRFGKSLNKTIAESDKRIAVIASGDLSHCLTKDAPAAYNPQGVEFDNKLIELLKNKDYQGILKLDYHLLENAAECGYRSILILLGLIHSYDHDVDILSYEGPLGVGYLVANFKLK